MAVRQMAVPVMPGTALDDDLVSYEEACEIIGIKLGTLYAAIKRRRLHPLRAPGAQKAFLRRGEVEAYRDKRPYVVAGAPGMPGVPGGMLAISPYADTPSDNARTPGMPGASPSADLTAIAGITDKHDQAVRDTFTGIAEKVSEQARLAMQPVMNGATLAAAFQMIAHIQAQRFSEAVGPELLDRLARNDRFTQDDMEAFIRAFQYVLTTVPDGVPPYTPDEVARVERIAQQVGDDARQLMQQSGKIAVSDHPDYPGTADSLTSAANGKRPGAKKKKEA